MPEKNNYVNESDLTNNSENNNAPIDDKFVLEIETNFTDKQLKQISDSINEAFSKSFKNIKQETIDNISKEALKQTESVLKEQNKQTQNLIKEIFSVNKFEDFFSKSFGSINKTLENFNKKSQLSSKTLENFAPDKM